MTQTQTVETRWVNLPVAENTAPGKTMQCYLAHPKGEGPWPAVIVFMEIFGINAHIREVTERLATEGYVALAINYYHRTTENMDLLYSEADVEEGRRHKMQTTREGLLTDTQTSLDYLKTLPEVSSKDGSGDFRFGTIGFCFGGHVAYIAATLPEIKATASFYGGGIAGSPGPGGGAPTVSHTSEITGEILCLFGEQDPLIPHSHTVEIYKALKDANIPHEVIRYPEAGHGFFCNHRQDFNPLVAKDAWARTMKLFSARLK